VIDVHLDDLAAVTSLKRACSLLGASRATQYRRRQPPVAGPPAPRPAPTNALTEAERQHVLTVLRSPEYCDLAPAQVWARLLDDGIYLCSISTMYRLLAVAGENRERRRQRTHPANKKPELIATAPNEVWSWDITKLPGPAAWTSFYLYVILDIFSRYVVGWLAAGRESKILARRMIATTLDCQGIQPRELTLHADRGAAMISKPVAFLLADLGATKSHSRPRVSNDNPYSESHFKTMKYRPEMPKRFGSVEHVCATFGDLFGWYNHEHHHSGLGLVTPYEVHHGLAAQTIERRAEVLARAYAEHPERFVRGMPRPPAPPREVWINKPLAGVASPVDPFESIRAKTDLTRASETNELEVARGATTPEREGIPIAVAL
jgi:putative transposase